MNAEEYFATLLAITTNITLADVSITRVPFLFSVLFPFQPPLVPAIDVASIVKML